MYDIAIIGYGPAGITAAIYAARKKLRVLLVGDFPGGEVQNSGEIENWPGDGHTDGLALADKLIKHLKTHTDQVTIQEGRVTKIERVEGKFVTTMENGDRHESTTVIYATGRHPRLLDVSGEKEMKNKGVTYCATCDAPLFADQDVVVIGGGNTGAEAVIMLQKIARSIHLLHISDKLGADAVLVDNFMKDPKVTIHYNARTTGITGEGMVQNITFIDEKTQKESTLAVTGVFVAIGAIPNNEPIKGLVELDKFGAVVADRYGVTSLPGFFAAGDVTNIRDAQIVVAAGHGCSAALSAGDYLSRQSGKAS